MPVSAPTYSHLLSAVYTKLREQYPVSEEDKTHLADVSKWLADGKKQLENIKDLSQQEAESALERYFNSRPRRRSGRPSNHHLPRSRVVKEVLSTHLIELGLRHLPEHELDEFVQKVTDRIIA